MLRQQQSRLGRVAAQGSLRVEELAAPDLALRLPVDDEALFYRPPEVHLAEVPASLELGSDVDSPAAVARDTVWDHAWGLFVLVRRRGLGGDVGRGADESCLDRVPAIVDYERLREAGLACL